MAKFGIDIDEVLRALVPQMVKLYNRYFNERMSTEDVKDFNVDISFPKVKEATGESASKWFFQEHGYELFFESPAIKGAANAIKRLKKMGHEIYIISYQKTSANKIDTICWLQKHNIEYDGICFIKNKTLVHLDYLIDDNDWNFINCNCTHGILITAPYNKKLSTEQILASSNCQTMERFESLSTYVKSIEK